MTNPGSAKISILIIDDEDLIQHLGRRVLEHEGYTVYTAGDSQEAARLMDLYRNEIKLAIIDIVMPDIEGTTLGSMLRKINPSLTLLFSSGYGLTVEVQELMAQGGVDFIDKPFTRDDIVKKVQSLVVSPSVR